MQRRATSKKRAAEAEKEIDMGDKEATSVEDIKVLVPPVEHKPVSYTHLDVYKRQIVRFVKAQRIPRSPRVDA